VSIYRGAGESEYAIQEEQQHFQLPASRPTLQLHHSHMMKS